MASAIQLITADNDEGYLQHARPEPHSWEWLHPKKIFVTEDLHNFHTPGENPAELEALERH